MSEPTNEPGRLSLSKIDLDFLADRLHQQDWGSGFLDRATGEVWPGADGEVLGFDDEDVDVEEIDWIGLGGEIGSHQAYQDMVEFAEAVPDAALRDRLLVALDGRGAFSRFRGVVYDTPDRIGPVWNRFSGLRSQQRAVAWLVEMELVDPAEAEPAGERLHREAAAVLETVRTRRSP